MNQNQVVPACEWLTSSPAGITGQNASAGGHVAWPERAILAPSPAGVSHRTQIDPNDYLRASPVVGR